MKLSNQESESSFFRSSAVVNSFTTEEMITVYFSLESLINEMQLLLSNKSSVLNYSNDELQAFSMAKRTWENALSAHGKIKMTLERIGVSGSF